MKFSLIAALQILIVVNADPSGKDGPNFGDVVKDNLNKFKESMKCAYDGIVPIIPDMREIGNSSDFNDYFL